MLLIAQVSTNAFQSAIISLLQMGSLQACLRHVLTLLDLHHMLRGFVFTRLPWWRHCHQYLLPFAAGRESCEGFLILLHHKPTSLSESLYYTTLELAREDEGLLYAVEDEEWAWSTGLFIQSTQYPSGRRHSVGEATLIRTYSLAMRSLGDLFQRIYSTLR